jgi:hypothetical protein
MNVASLRRTVAPIFAIALLCGCADDSTPAIGTEDSGTERSDTRGSDSSVETDTTDVGTIDDTTPADGSGTPDGGTNALSCQAWDMGLAQPYRSPPPTGCANLDGLERYHCAEEWMWYTLSDDAPARDTARAELLAVIDAAGEDADPLAVSRMWALRGQLTMAMVVEQGRFDLATGITDDFDQAMLLDPNNPIIPSFADSLELVFAYRGGDEAALARLETEIWDNVERCPLGNILSISGIALGLPLSSGWPASIIDALEDWQCTGANFCTQNTWKAPYARPGLAYHFAEGYARVGQRDRAATYLAEAIASPAFDEWPYADFVQATSDDQTAWMDEFAGLGQDGDASPMMYAGQNFGCIFCHATNPPAELVPSMRLTLVEEEGSGGEGSGSEGSGEGSGSGGDGACEGAMDYTIITTTDDLAGKMSGCAFSCFSSSDPDCQTNCVQTETGLSEPCSACFGENISCTVSSCALQCISPDSAGCASCQATNCAPAFADCAGITPP